jgi:hypothetical protein
MNEKPYRNEPGYEKAKGTEKELKNYLVYITHEVDLITRQTLNGK